MTRYRISPVVSGLVSLASLGVFAIIAWNVMRPTALIDLDEKLALQFSATKAALPHVTACVSVATDLGSRDFLLGLICVSSLVVLWRCPRNWVVPAVWVIILLGGDIINHTLKGVFQRPRPLAAATWGSWSFPSGHADAAMVNYGMIGYLLVLALPGRLARTIALVTLAGVILFVGFSRMYLTVHYLSDVLGGYAAGASWLAAWLTLIEAVRRRRPVAGTSD
jgi:undecaprenyl-diphosphatase